MLSALTLAAVAGEYLISSRARVGLAVAGWTTGGVIAVVGVAAATRRSTPADRPGWWLLLVGSVASLIGQGAGFFYSATSFGASPKLADVCWLTFAISAGSGLHRLCRGRWRLPAFSVLELVALIVAVSALVIALLWGDISSSRLPSLARITAVAYPILYVSAALVMLQAVLAAGIKVRRNRGLAVMLAGMMSVGTGFILWSPQLLAGDYTVGADAVDALWSIGMTLLGLGAWVARASVARTASRPAAEGGRGGFLPALTFVIIAAVQTVVNARDGVNDVVLSVGLSVIGLAMIVHASVLRHSQDKLLSRLHASERQLQDANRRLAEESRRDALTGLANRLRLEEDFADITASGERHGTGFCLVLIDLDRFKVYNDDQGHQAGDRVLRQVASLLNQTGRAGERAYRYGGEELLLVLRDQNLEAGQAASERHRAQLQALAIPHPLNHPHAVVTFSAGIAVSEPGETPEQVLHRADTALYHAKTQGRNQIAVGRPDPQPSRLSPNPDPRILLPRL